MTCRRSLWPQDDVRAADVLEHGRADLAGERALRSRSTCPGRPGRCAMHRRPAPPPAGTRTAGRRPRRLLARPRRTTLRPRPSAKSTLPSGYRVFIFQLPAMNGFAHHSSPCDLRHEVLRLTAPALHNSSRYARGKLPSTCSCRSAAGPLPRPRLNSAPPIDAPGRPRRRSIPSRVSCRAGCRYSSG